MKIITHPDNLELIKRMFHEDKFGRELYAIPIVTNRHMEREKWTGRYILPNGKAVVPEAVRVVQGRFTEWGGNDWENKLLVEWGAIRKEMEPLFYQIDDLNIYRMALELPIMAMPPFIVMVTT